MENNEIDREIFNLHDSNDAQNYKLKKEELEKRFNFFLRKPGVLVNYNDDMNQDERLPDLDLTIFNGLKFNQIFKKELFPDKQKYKAVVYGLFLKNMRNEVSDYTVYTTYSLLIFYRSPQMTKERKLASS